MNNVLLYIGGFVVVVLALLFAVPHFIDWNSYRGVFEEEASRVLGRDVRIGGAVNLRLLPAPYVSLEKLKIADPSSSTGDSLFRAESFTLWLSVPPLLKGVLEANKIEVRRPVVQLVSSPEGGGNWQSLAINEGQLSLVPQGVSLRSVTITDGAIVIGTTERAEIARLEAINGELMADALNGPYKFTGTLTAGGAKRDVRVATSAAEPNQELRFKATVKTPDTGNSYTVSGRVNDLKARAKVEGDLTAELSTALFAPSASPAAAVNAPKSEMTAKISGDATGVEFKDVALTLSQGETPQMISGSAKVSWPQRTKIDVSLTSRWLDLDRLSGTGKAVPVDLARYLFDALEQSLPNEADTSTKILLDQVTLGGDSVSDVRFQASRAGGALELKDVRASLPGGARIQFDGQLAGAEAARVLTGAIALSGQSLQRFVGWGTAKDGLVNSRADGPFAIEGAMTLSHANIAIKNATAEVAGMPLSGEFEASLDGRRKVSVVLEGERLDAGAIWPGLLAPELAASLLRAQGTAIASSGKPAAPGENAPAATAGSSSPNVQELTPQDMDIRLRLRAAEVLDGDRVLKNVDADLSIDNGALSMPRLNFVTAAGVGVELEGETKASGVANKAEGGTVEPVAGGRTGIVRGMVSASDGAAILALSRALDLDADAQATPQTMAALAPLRLAGSIDYGARTAQSADVQIDGVAGSARVTASLLLDSGWLGWRTSASDITVSAESGNIAQTIAALLGGGGAKVTAADFDPPRPGTFAIKAISDSSGNFLSNAVLAADGLEAKFDGTSAFAAKDGWRTAGAVLLKTNDARIPLTLAGLKTGKGNGEVPLNGVIKVESNAAGQTYVFDDLKAGGSKLSGRVSLAANADPATKAQTGAIDADLAVDSGSIPALLAMLTTNAAAAPPVASATDNDDKNAAAAKKKRAVVSSAPAAAAAAADDPLIWPVQSFDTGLFANLTGHVKATFGSLSIEPGLSLGDAVFDASIMPGHIEVAHIDGKALGGTVASAFTLDKDPVGVKLTAAFALRAGGPNNSNAVLKFDASGRASSPAGLIADMKGTGELALAEAALHVNSPAALTGVAEAALQGKGPAAGEDLANAVRAALKDSSQSLGGFSIPLTVADGVVRFDKVRLDAAQGRSQFDAVIQLDTLKLVSEWQIEPKVARTNAPGASSDRLTLAPVSIVYNGKLKDLATLEPEVAVAGLERELSVRKMERDVEELERLRKADQAQAAAELERRKAQEAERIRAAAAAKAAKDAAAAANAAQISVPANTAAQTSGEIVAPQSSGGMAAPRSSGGASPDPHGGQTIQPQKFDGGAALPAQPSSVTAQGDPGSGDSTASGDPASGDQGASNLGSPPSSWRPAIIHKRKPPDQPAWKPFQVTPY